MDLRRQEEERGYNPSPSLSPAAPPPPPPPHPIKESAFSKPLLPLNSSLVQRGDGGETRNGGSGYALAPSPFNPASHHYHAMAGRRGGVNIGRGDSLKSPASMTSDSGNSLQTEVIWHYRECQRNHAAGIGGHVVDGCCEFMPSDDVTLKCAACGCHRSFHRKVCSPNPSGSTPLFSRKGAVMHRSPPQLLPPPLPPPPIPPPSQPPRSTTDQSSSEEMTGGTPQQSQTTTASPTKKRFRTKFTPDQKEKMFKFAESLSWRFQKPDDAAIDEFCAEAGVNRQVLKVWMHNNKYTYKKQEQYQPSPPQKETPQEGKHQDHQQIP
jgi:ZF-HD class homeobox domain-containing protein